MRQKDDHHIASSSLWHPFAAANASNGGVAITRLEIVNARRESKMRNLMEYIFYRLMVRAWHIHKQVANISEKDRAGLVAEVLLIEACRDPRSTTNWEDQR